MFETEGYGLATQQQTQQALPLGQAVEAKKPELTPTNANVKHIGEAK